MELVFAVVRGALLGSAWVTGFSYNEVNVLVYYLAIPLVYFALIDRILGRHYLKVAWIAVWTGIMLAAPSFEAFCDGVFDGSVDFLMLFGGVGLDYIAASVIICVVMPAVVLIALVL